MITFSLFSRQVRHGAVAAGAVSGQRGGCRARALAGAAAGARHEAAVFLDFVHEAVGAGAATSEGTPRTPQMCIYDVARIGGNYALGGRDARVYL